LLHVVMSQIEAVRDGTVGNHYDLFGHDEGLDNGWVSQT
jgi:hypothetical protein